MISSLDQAVTLARSADRRPLHASRALSPDFPGTLKQNAALEQVNLLRLAPGFTMFHNLPFTALWFNSPHMQSPLTYLQENESRFVRELCDYLRFPSVSAQSHHRKDVDGAARWLVEHCQSIGLHTRLCPTEGNPVVIAQTPRNQSASSRQRPHFVVYGHYDVQPAE